MHKLTAKWREDAACSGLTDLFFPEADGVGKNLFAKPAISICDSCPVKKPCAEYALEMGESHGVWGGILLTPTQTAATKRRKLLDVIVEAA